MYEQRDVIVGNDFFFTYLQYKGQNLFNGWKFVFNKIYCNVEIDLKMNLHVTEELNMRSQAS
jgi:hypothetical protein